MANGARRDDRKTEYRAPSGAERKSGASTGASTGGAAPKKHMHATREPNLKKKSKSTALAAKKVLPGIVKEEKVRTIRETAKRDFPTSVIFLAIMCTVLFMYIIYNMVQINEYTVELDALQKRIETLASTEKDLKLEVDKKNDLRVIEELAAGEYGMIKKDSVEKLYVNVGDEERSEAAETDESSSSAEGFIPSIMNAIGRNFFD